MDGPARNNAVLRIHGEQEIACENQWRAGHAEAPMPYQRKCRAEFRTKSAARSPIMVTGAWVLQVGMIGITEASAIRRPSTPCTASRSSTTDMSSLPIFAVPQV